MTKKVEGAKKPLLIFSVMDNTQHLFINKVLNIVRDADNQSGGDGHVVLLTGGVVGGEEEVTMNDQSMNEIRLNHTKKRKQ